MNIYEHFEYPPEGILNWFIPSLVVVSLATIYTIQQKKSTTPFLTRPKWIPTFSQACLSILIILLFISLVPFFPEAPIAIPPSWAQTIALDNLDELRTTFSVPTTPPPVIDLTFVSNSLRFALPFNVSTNLTVGDLHSALMTHFKIKDAVILELPKRGEWKHRFLLFANNQQLSDKAIRHNGTRTNTNDLTLKDTNVANDSLLEIRVELSQAYTVELRGTDSAQPANVSAPPHSTYKY